MFLCEERLCDDSDEKTIIYTCDRYWVSSNRGTIKTNDNYYGDEFVELNSGTIEVNKSLVKSNFKMVTLNEVSGIVCNSSARDDEDNVISGTVTTNSGEVYSYDGTVVSNTSTGTEYFEVLIKNSGSNHISVSSNNLKSAYQRQWLGQVAGRQETATVTLTPDTGYEIKEINKLPGNVSAVKNGDGTWTLSVTSGQRTEINVPEATVIPCHVTVHNGSGSGDYARGESVTITAGASVTITAADPPAGQRFKEWTNLSNSWIISGSKTSIKGAQKNDL